LGDFRSWHFSEVAVLEIERYCTSANHAADLTLSRAQKKEPASNMQDKQNWFARATRQTNDMTFLEQVPLIAVAM
jgi:hypothetical protein